MLLAARTSSRHLPTTDMADPSRKRTREAFPDWEVKCFGPAVRSYRDLTGAKRLASSMAQGLAQDAYAHSITSRPVITRQGKKTHLGRGFAMISRLRRRRVERAACVWSSSVPDSQESIGGSGYTSRIMEHAGELRRYWSRGRSRASDEPWAIGRRAARSRRCGHRQTLTDTNKIPSTGRPKFSRLRGCSELKWSAFQKVQLVCPDHPQAASKSAGLVRTTGGLMSCVTCMSLSPKPCAVALGTQQKAAEESGVR
ncbi:hypothetical protein QBC40DRAFT_346868 [Triangularia verruculosa]|uniref:Uncharacterized protein n=1 Tax=Triangularia verruculosa TaxID=2587418 RepID=A0AAN6XQI3_9PEZI|nr:hypothetical protein QBC40DRAFT_346868 [Triangularia verruculosa]